MRRHIILAIAVLFIAAAPARAPAALEAEALRDSIIAGLEGKVGPLGAVPLTYDEVKVSPRGEGFRVEITALASVADGEGVWADIGDVSFNVEEEGEGLYRVGDFAGVDNVGLMAADGALFGRFAYRLERFEGVWSADLVGFLDADFLAHDFRFALVDASLKVSLDRLGGVNRASRAADGRYDIQGRGRAEKLRIEAAGKGALEVAEFEVETSTRGLDIAAYGRLTREWDVLRQRETPPSEAEMAAMLERMAESVELLPGGFAQRARITDLSASDPDGAPLFRLGELEWDAAASGFDQALAELRFGARHGGLDPAAAALADLGALRALVPTEADFVLAVERVPGQTLWRALLTAMAAGAMAESGSSGAAALPNPMILMSVLGPAFEQAGTRLRLPRLRFVSEALEIRAEGLAEVDPAAAMGYTASLDVSFYGLDTAIALLDGEIAAGNAEAQGGRMALGWLKTFAEPATDSEGRAMDRLALRLTADGELLLNGQPMGMPGMPQP